MSGWVDGGVYPRVETLTVIYVDVPGLFHRIVLLSSHIHVHKLTVL